MSFSHYRSRPTRTVVRYFDLIILIPNLIFLLFLIIKWYHTRTKLNFNKPLLFTVSCLIFIVSFVNIIRCLYSMIFAEQTLYAIGIILKILWLLVRFTLLCTELSLLVFGIYFGRSNPNRPWIKTIKILIISSICSLIYTITQGVLEFRGDTRPSSFQLTNYNLYSYGGMKFLLISSSIFLLMYIIIFFLPILCRQHRKYLPIRRSFYIYCFIMAIINGIQIIGTILNLTETTKFAMCIVDGTTCIFYICFAPFVYHQFLRRALSSQTLIPQVMYADSTIIDDDDDDDHLIDSEMNLNRPLLNYSLDHDENILNTGLIRSVIS
ncbi:unnamed protein product [Rotaria sordida]|uniref:Uncharacterized protein n=1 Tax=Rotaria sordida TaxID=392033 RepID=A0A814SS05_9BILA|nr:unnamed protein product [Rotaria sordida]CAF1339063.1 unnamed protein product [Rotaria sordida]CAF3666155.1 unnamed protein product [Rotaria sordida]CAF3965852.1 unnamed protein product [Rotaria sordida]